MKCKMKFYKENCYFTILMLFFFHRDGILIVPSIYKLRRCGTFLIFGT